MSSKRKKNVGLSITQVAQACGVSRTTLRRLDEEGLLKPSNKPQAGEKREYNAKDVLRLCRILKLQECGMTHGLIADMLNNGDEYTDTIRLLEARIRFLQDIVNDMKACSNKANHLSVNIHELSENYVYEKFFPFVSGYAYTASAASETLAEAVSAGCRLDMEKGLALKYASFADLMAGRHMQDGFTIGIPVLPDSNTENIVFYPRQHVLSVMWFGTYENISEGLYVVRTEVEKRHLKPLGPLYFRMVFDALLEYNTKEDQNLVNIVLPVEPA